MPTFAPDLVAFGDQAGFGQWDVGHGREHIQFVQTLVGLSAPISIPDYSFLSFLGNPQPELINAHYEVHEFLRSATGVTGIDLSAVDLQSGAGFDEWLNFHRQEHAQIRAVLGLS